MEKTFKQILEGYRLFQEKYVQGDNTILRSLSKHGQKPQIMLIACCDSRVDPALILQCDPGDLFVARNVANIVPPYQKDEALHGTSAALEFGVCLLQVRHLILLGHSQCSGVAAALKQQLDKNDFISHWVSTIQQKNNEITDPDEYAKAALMISYENCLTFPWIKQRMAENNLLIHRWFFDIKKGQIFTYSDVYELYQALEL